MRAKRSNLSANPSEASRGWKQSTAVNHPHPGPHPRPFRYVHTPLRGWDLRRTLPRGGSAGNPSLEEACELGSETDGGEGVITSEAKQSLSANPSEASRGEWHKAPQSITPPRPSPPSVSLRPTPLRGWDLRRTLPRGGSAEGPSLEEACGRSEANGGEGVIASEAKQSLSANPSEANGGEGNKAPQSITPTQALTPVRFATSTRLFEAGTFGGPSLGGGSPKVPASKRRVDVAKRTGVRRHCEAKRSNLSANPSEASRVRKQSTAVNHPHPGPHPRPFRYVHASSRLGPSADPPRGGSAVPASRRVDNIAKRT